jgi:hypothetical protein
MTCTFAEGHDRWSALGPGKGGQGLGAGVLQAAGEGI